MHLTEISLRHRATVFFVLAGVVLLGLSAYLTLPRESNPDIELPIVVAYAQYPGASPADVESQVTRVLERELKGLDGLKKLTSSSQEGISSVTAEFVSGTDIDEALQKVRDKVDLAKVDFPEEVEEPMIQEFSFSDIPVLQVHLAGEVGPAVLKRLAEDLQDRLEGLTGVLRVDLVGGLEREVRVEVDPERLRLYGLSLNDVVDAVRDENVSIPGGDMDVGDLSYAVRVPGEVDDPLHVADFVITTYEGSPVFVRDLATVRFGFEDRLSYARIDGKESVSLSVQKRQGANIIQVADAVRAEVDEQRALWPQSVTATILADQSHDIRRMVSDLENNILSGLVLVVLVLMFVLGFRTAVFVGLAIPFSMMLTFIAIQLSGVTLNMIVLFSLVLAVGMLVDNAVVVIENIYRHMQQGRTPLKAAAVGTRQVGAAITVSTFTTVGAFAPLLFWPGVVGDFMFYLPLTVSAALLASLAIAFTINPVMCASFLRVPSSALAKESPQGAYREGDDDLEGVDEEEDLDDESEDLFTAPKSFKERIGARIASTYRDLLRWSLDHRLLVVAGTFAVFFAVLMLYGRFNKGVEFFPETEPPQIVVDLDLRPGARLDKTDEVVRQLEARLTDVPDLEVRATGTGAGSQSDFGGGNRAAGTQGRITLDLVDREDRSQSSFVTMAKVRETTGRIPGVTVDVKRPPEGPEVGDPLVIEIAGDDFATLGAIAARVREAIVDIPGLVSLDDDFDPARPELTLRVDRVQAARQGLTTADVATTVRTAVNGTKASVYRYGEDEADIVVRLAEQYRRSPESLMQLNVVNEQGVQVPLATVARLDRTSSLTSINHKDRKRMVTVSGKVTTPAMAEPVRAEAARRIEQLEGLLPTGYSLAFGGQSAEEDEAKSFLSKAFLYAILVVLALMVGKFDSLAVPMIILTSVVMSMIGVLIGLMVTGLPFGIIMTGLGVISLAGIVVNNAIVLLDYGEQLSARGLPRRKVVLTTGARRMRPVLLTAVTTILGLIPLSTGIEFNFRELHFATGGESSQWWRSMAVAVIFGLGFATFLTLVLVPVLYDLLLQFREWRSRRKASSADQADQETVPEDPPLEDAEAAALEAAEPVAGGSS